MAERWGISDEFTFCEICMSDVTLTQSSSVWSFRESLGSHFLAESQPENAGQERTWRTCEV